ncbi:MAG TPA: SH3 domain-containing protein [Syntrophales bacterium]|nr:SH3 domain-containing protein [Syntrophales bacterium]HPN24602.1 SH3 domain-containing protein [Syntrophales bacterium]
MPKKPRRTAILLKLRVLIILIALFFPAFLSCAEKPVLTLWESQGMAPQRLRNVDPDFESADFWAARAPEPRALILTPEEIEALNRAALKYPANLVDIFALPERLERSHLQDMIDDLEKLKNGPPGYDHTNHPLTKKFYDRIESVIGTLPETLPLQYGVITSRTNLRRLPTNEIFLDKPFRGGFDRFQFTLVECGTPVAIFHATRERDWYLIQLSHTKGWVEASQIATAPKQEVLDFARSNPLVVTGSRVEVYANPSLDQHAATLQMGATLPLESRKVSHCRVTLPARNDDGTLKRAAGYVRASDDVHDGYLPFTITNLYRQAFKLLNHPYGWGDLYEGRDCSRFIMDIYRCFGFNMPRNSLRQSQFNGKYRSDIHDLEDGEKIEFLKKYDGRPAILYIPGHIMLLLGVIDGKPYIIHSAWAYNDESGFFTRETKYIGRVAVSDTSLGQGTRGGSLLKRITAVTPMDEKDKSFP